MATRYLIIEDEMAAYHLLSTQLRELRPDAEIIGPLQTIDDAIEFFETQPKPDLAFVDIHLADGSSFSIFDNVEVKCPIVFTTAYEQYALQAFEVNCIDYLLKPIDSNKLEHALNKHDILSPNVISLVKEAIQAGQPSTRYNSCLLINQRDRTIPVPVSDIAIIYLEEQIVTLLTFSDESYTVNSNLEDLCAKLDPARFYRANRQQIIARTAVKDFSSWFGHKLSVNLVIPFDNKIIISKTKITDFKNWITK